MYENLINIDRLARYDSKIKETIPEPSSEEELEAIIGDSQYVQVNIYNRSGSSEGYQYFMSGSKKIKYGESLGLYSPYNSEPDGSGQVYTSTSTAPFGVDVLNLYPTSSSFYAYFSVPIQGYSSEHFEYISLPITNPYIIPDIGDVCTKLKIAETKWFSCWQDKIGNYYFPGDTIYFQENMTFYPVWNKYMILYYEPQFNLETGEVKSDGALVKVEEVSDGSLTLYDLMNTDWITDYLPESLYYKFNSYKIVNGYSSSANGAFNPLKSFSTRFFRCTRSLSCRSIIFTLPEGFLYNGSNTVTYNVSNFTDKLNVSALSMTKPTIYDASLVGFRIKNTDILLNSLTYLDFINQFKDQIELVGVNLVANIELEPVYSGYRVRIILPSSYEYVGFEGNVIETYAMNYITLPEPILPENKQLSYYYDSERYSGGSQGNFYSGEPIQLIRASSTDMLYGHGYYPGYGYVINLTASVTTIDTTPTHQTTINFDMNGYTGATVSSNTYDIGVSLFSRSQYRSFRNYSSILKYWTTNQDGTGDRYYDLSKNDIDYTDEITLYAQWTDSTFNYTIKFNSNGGFGYEDDLSATYGTSKTIPTTLTKHVFHSTKTFKSWNSSPDGTGMTYSVNSLRAPREEDIIDGVLTLYAIWG